MLSGNKNMDKEPITVEGLLKIKKELEDLKNIKSTIIITAIAEARAHGDLKENATKLISDNTFPSDKIRQYITLPATLDKKINN